MLISPIHSDDFACIPIFVEFRAVTGNPPTQSQSNEPRSHSGKTRRKQEFFLLKKQIKKQIV